MVNKSAAPASGRLQPLQLLDPETDFVVVLAGQVALDELAVEAGGAFFTRSAASALGKRRIGSGATRQRQKFISNSLHHTSCGRMFGSRWARNRLASNRSR